MNSTSTNSPDTALNTTWEHQHRILAAPSFWCPIEPDDPHPDAHEFGDAARAWIQRYALELDPTQLRRLEQADLGALTARTMPYGTPGPLALMARLHGVLFALDDLVDEGDATPAQVAHETACIQRCLDADAPPRPDDSPFARALREIRIQLAKYATEPQLQRWITGMATYLSALPDETACRRASAPPCLRDYLPMWMGAIGMAPATAMIPIVFDCEVADAALDQAPVHALTEMTWALVAIDNDLYSRSKEIKRAGDDLNIIDVLACQYDLTQPQAQNEAMALRDRIMVFFLRLHAQTHPTADPSLQQYLYGLRQFVRGHLEWALRCRRYATGRAGEEWWAPAPVDLAGATPELEVLTRWQHLAD